MIDVLKKRKKSFVLLGDVLVMSQFSYSNSDGFKQEEEGYFSWRISMSLPSPPEDLRLPPSNGHGCKFTSIWTQTVGIFCE